MVGADGVLTFNPSFKLNTLPVDETKPSCLRCILNGFECDGYPRSEFIDENTRFPRADKLPSKKKDLNASAKNVALLKRSYSPSPLHSDICLFHLVSSYFPVVGARDDLPPWIGLRALDNESSLAYQCLQSLARAYFGRVQSAPVIATEGTQMYAQSLRRLNAQLGNPTWRGDSDTMLSIMILGVYEVCTGIPSPTFRKSVLLTYCR